MLWRCNWVKQRRKILNTRSFSSIHCQFSPKAREYSRENTAGPRRIAPKPLTHDSVYSCLRESPSDLKTLNFFFWCANQNNYFHDDRAFDHMVGVAEKLTPECEGLPVENEQENSIVTRELKFNQKKRGRGLVQGTKSSALTVTWYGWNS